MNPKQRVIAFQNIFDILLFATHATEPFTMKDLRDYVLDAPNNTIQCYVQELINLFGSIKIAKDKVKMADFNGFLLVSVPIENGLADVYIHKVEQAIRDHESIYGGGESHAN
ncbi:hypothetical protein ACVYEL_19130 [Acinetobacter baumannii]